MQCLLSVSGSRGPVFRRYLLIGQIDEEETWAQEISVCDLFFLIYSYNKKKLNFRVLPLAPNVRSCDMAPSATPSDMASPAEASTLVW